MNKCEICNKAIEKDSQFINDKWYHNDCIEKLTDILNKMQKENERLKKENNNLNSYYEYYKYLADKQNKLMIDYKSRCEKANTLLQKRYEEDKKIFNANYDFKFILDFEEELLQTLQGVGKE